MSQPAQGLSTGRMGCGFAVVLIGLVLLTGTVMSGIPSLGAPVRLALTAVATQRPFVIFASPVRPVATESPFVPTSTGLPATSPPSPTSTSPSDNPWVASIPAAACIPTDIPQSGRVVQVIDAATIRVLMDGDGRIYTVRYLGVGYPTSPDPHLLREGLQQNVDLTYNQRATLVRDLTDQDSYGRLLRYVMVGKAFLNFEMIARGWLTAVAIPPDTACSSAFQAAQQQAQAQGLGIWLSATLAP